MKGALEGEAALPDLEVDSLTAEGGVPDLKVKRPAGDLQLCLRVFQPPRSAVGNDLEGGGAAPFCVDVERGNQRQGLAPRGLVLKIPALKIGACLLRAAEKFHDSSPQIQFSLNLGILYGMSSDD